jgi:hypothetical protein
MNQRKECPQELLNFCQQELTAIRQQIDESLEHLAKGETLAALGAIDGLEQRTAYASVALRLVARIYPITLQAELNLNQS